jgi:predicted dehydrogenase
MTKTRWGVLSTAGIGTEKVIPGINRSKTAFVAAIASRDGARAKAAADELGIDKAYGSYAELLTDPDIDVIYNPLPNHLHVPLTLQAVAAGKHVLCEKPIALNKEEAEQLLAISGDRMVMEAFMVRFHPQWLKMRELVQSGALGEVRSVQCYFSYFNRDPDNIRNNAEIGGGGLMDIGCYPMVAGRFLFGAEPERVIALIDRDPEFRTDRLASAILDFGGGRRVDFTVSTQAVPYQRVHAVGTEKRAEIIVPFNPAPGEVTTIRIDNGSDPASDGNEIVTLPECDQYAEQADAFSAAVRGETELPYGPEDAVRNMSILDALLRSETSGKWEPVS